MSVYLSLGSNLGSRAQNLSGALSFLENSRKVNIEAVSHVYESAPLELLEQPRFYNIAVRAETGLSPADLLLLCKQAEQSGGRVKTVRYGPRNIDVDIICWDGVTVCTPELTIPHIKARGRAFVLLPLREILTDCGTFDPERYLKEIPAQDIFPVGELNVLAKREEQSKK